MSDYRNLSFRLIDAGLNLRDVADAVGQGKWVRLSNVGTPQEALISVRDGLGLFASLGFEPIHTIRRIGGGTILFGMGQGLTTQTTSITTTGFSGNPLSFIPFKPIGASETWTYIGDSLQLKKFQVDGSYFQWGIDPPTSATTAILSGAGGLDTSVAGAVSYDWRVTYASSRTGAESNPSPESTFFISGTGVAALVSIPPSADPQVNEVRFYRRGGVITDQWRLSGVVPNNPALPTIDFLDDREDSEIIFANPLPQDKFRPFTSVDASGVTAKGVPLPYLAGPVLGKYILACGDPHRPGYLYWTNPEDPDSAAADNNIQVTAPTEPLIGILIYNGQPFVYSRDNLYAIDFGVQGLTFVARKAPFGRGSAGPWSACVGPQIFICSQDGIYRTGGDDPGVSITEDAIRPLFHGKRVDDFYPINFSQPQDLRLYFVGQDLHFIYRDMNITPQTPSGRLRHLVWSSIYERWHSSVELSDVTRSLYGDENQSLTRLILGSETGNVFIQKPDLTSDNGVGITVVAQTGYIDFGMPQTFKELGNLIVDADPQNSPITITPIVNNSGATLTPFIINGNGRQKFALPFADNYVHSVALKFEFVPLGTAVPSIYQFDLLWRPDEEGIRHWEFPPTAHGMSGWQIIRDGYLTIRSSSELTLRVAIDGAVFNVPFRSTSNTGGAKKKVFFDMPPVKGKLFQWFVDGGGDFRLYGEDCEIRTKSWNTNLGYQLVSPFSKVE